MKVSLLVGFICVAGCWTGCHEARYTPAISAFKKQQKKEKEEEKQAKLQADADAQPDAEAMGTPKRKDSIFDKFRSKTSKVA